MEKLRKQVQRARRRLILEQFLSRLVWCLFAIGLLVFNLLVTQVSGDINVTLKTLTPDTTGVGLSLGAWTGASCNLTIVEANALPNSKLIGNATASGEFCTRIADDLGRLTGPVSYEIEVTHF